MVETAEKTEWIESETFAVFDATSGFGPKFLATVCAMLNHRGGQILFYNKSKKNRQGLDHGALAELRRRLVRSLKDTQCIDPIPAVRFVERPSVSGVLLMVHVPEASTIHVCSVDKVCYDRQGTTNVAVQKLTDQWRLLERKQQYFPDTRIIQGLTYDHFNFDVYQKAINHISKTRAGHPWLRLDFDDVMKSSGLWREDLQQGTEGYTLGALLLFGTDQAIHSVLPWLRVDAICEKPGLMYFDRLVVSTNLIDGFHQVLDFVAKHLPDVSHLVGKDRVAVRDQIFREAIGNMLIHQDYGSQLASMLIIHPDRSVTLQNSNKAHYHQQINPQDYSPKPKNPTIGRFFREMGLAEELGFGLKKISSNMAYYSNGQAEFWDKRTFSTFIPAPDFSPVSTHQPVVEAPVSEPVTVTPSPVMIHTPAPEPVIETFSEPRPLPETPQQLENSPIDESQIFGSKAVHTTGALDNLNPTKRQRAIDILRLLISEQKVQTQILMRHFGISRETVAREMRFLKEQGWVNFEGAFKTGFYVITPAGKNALATF